MWGGIWDRANTQQRIFGEYKGSEGYCQGIMVIIDEIPLRCLSELQTNTRNLAHRPVVVAWAVRWIVDTWDGETTYLLRRGLDAVHGIDELVQLRRQELVREVCVLGEHISRQVVIVVLDVQ